MLKNFPCKQNLPYPKNIKKEFSPKCSSSFKNFIRHSRIRTSLRIIIIIRSKYRKQNVQQHLLDIKITRLIYDKRAKEVLARNHGVLEIIPQRGRSFLPLQRSTSNVEERDKSIIVGRPDLKNAKRYLIPAFIRLPSAISATDLY